MSGSGLVLRIAEPDGEPAGTVLCVHGFPESSHMWGTLLPLAAAAGWRAVAPDLPGFGDSPLAADGTWATHIAALADFHAEQDLGPVVLVAHDWGTLIGLRFACDHPEHVRALVISDGGFFPDGKWHGMAKALREPGIGEEVIAGFTREGMTELMAQVAPGMTQRDVAECFKALATDAHRRAQLELYRSGNFAELAPYQGRLAALGVPTLLLWGQDDPFAPVAGAHRLAREIPHAQLQILEGVGHFIFADAPRAAADAVVAFLASLPR
jgi:haloalkane dehalogenase